MYCEQQQNIKITHLTFFSSTCGTFTRIDHMPGRKTSLNTSKKTEITQSMFFNQNISQSEIHNRKKSRKTSNIWKLNNICLNNTRDKEEITRET